MYGCSALSESRGGGNVGRDSGAGSGSGARMSDQSGSFVVHGRHRRRPSALRLPLVAEHIAEYSRRRRVHRAADVPRTAAAQSGVARRTDRSLPNPQHSVTADD